MLDIFLLRITVEPALITHKTEATMLLSEAQSTIIHRATTAHFLFFLFDEDSRAFGGCCDL